MFAIYLPGEEAQDFVELLGGGLADFVGTTSLRYFQWKTKQVYGVTGLKQLQALVVVYAGKKTVVFAKGPKVSFSQGGGTFLARRGSFKFRLANRKKVLVGRVGEWIVAGLQDWIVRASSMVPDRHACRAVLRALQETLTPNLFRDPYHRAIFIEPQYRTVGFWSTRRGTTILLPADAQAPKVIEFLKSKARWFKEKQVSRLFEDAGNHAKMADIGVTFMRILKRADTFVITSKGSFFDAAVFLVASRLRPFFYSKVK